MRFSQGVNELYKSTTFLPTLTNGTAFFESSVHSRSRFSLATLAAVISTLPFFILGKIFFKGLVSFLSLYIASSNEHNLLHVSFRSKTPHSVAFKRFTVTLIKYTCHARTQSIVVSVGISLSMISSKGACGSAALFN